MSEITTNNFVSQDPIINDGYTHIYNRILSALEDDNVDDKSKRIIFARQITDAIWQLVLSVNKPWPTEKYNNFANTKSMVTSIVSSIY